MLDKHGPVRRDRRRRGQGRLAGRSSRARLDAAAARRRRRSRPATSRPRQAAKERHRGHQDRSAYFLLVFGGIALFVGAFVIFNTHLDHGRPAHPRARDAAHARRLAAAGAALGAARDAWSSACVASVIGLLARARHRQGPERAVRGARRRPAEGRHRARRPARSSSRMLAGTLVTLLAGLFPALRATRVPPIAAVREGAALPRVAARPRPALRRGRDDRCSGVAADRRRRVRRRRHAEAVLVLAGRRHAAAVPRRRHARRATSSGRSPRWSACPPAASAARPGRLAAQNAVRNPGRTASTAAALMIGLALVTFVATLGSRPAQDSFADSLERADHAPTTSCRRAATRRRRRSRGRRPGARRRRPA